MINLSPEPFSIPARPLSGRATPSAGGRVIKAVLFDIDGTLLKCFGAGKKSLIEACMEVFGTIGTMHAVDFQGKTDPLILLESLAIMGFKEEDIHRNIEELKSRYFHHLRTNMYDDSSVLLPGVEDLLERLRDHDGVLLGLLTGNFRESARIKLDRFDLNRFFTFGVFGDDASYRNDMPPIARDMIRDSFNIDIPFRDIAIIGDTVHDIACAKSSGAVSISVGTGWADPGALLDLEPDYFFDDLSDVDEVMKAILG
ncbi:MAG: HAD hydrolase-like protein [Spirochaetes bacterium]|nr:HAD hydrolase-like protein [Spirochaetota bacterium]